jgi:hypothetical protein
MRSVLVVVYSYTGTSRLLAQRLCVEQGWPMGEIKETSGRAGWQGLIRCLVDSALHRHPQICYDGPAVEDFNAVVLVYPIWAGRPASPMRSFVAQMAPRTRHYALLSVMGRRGAARAGAELEDIVGRPPLLSAAFTAAQVQDGSCAARLADIAKAVAGNDGSRTQRQAELSPRAA